MPPRLRILAIGLALWGSGLPRAQAQRPEPPRAGALTAAAERLDRVVQAPDDTALRAPSREPALRLAPPGRRPAGRPAESIRGAGSLVTVGSSLAIVLGLFFVLAWMARRTMPLAAAVLPSEVVEVLGRTVMAGRQQVYLLRLGRKLLLVSGGSAGMETLGEVTDPDEVTRLVGLCQQSKPGSTTAAFKQVFEQLAGERTDGR